MNPQKERNDVSEVRDDLGLSRNGDRRNGVVGDGSLALNWRDLCFQAPEQKRALNLAKVRPSNVSFVSFFFSLFGRLIFKRFLGDSESVGWLSGIVGNLFQGESFSIFCLEQTKKWLV